MAGVGVELLGVVAVGIGAAATIYALMHALRRAGYELPRWALPAAIGLAMVGYSVWNDYAWFARAEARLPEGSVLLVTGEDSFVWAPWTYLLPVTVRFAAIDPAKITEANGIHRAEIMLVDRRSHTLIVPQDFDCANSKTRPANGEWMNVAQGDASFGAVCGQSGS